MTDAPGAILFDPADYASFGRRVLSAIIDFIIIGLITACVQLWFAYKYVPPDVRALPRSAAQQKLVEKYLSPQSGRIAMLDVGLLLIYLLPIRALPGGTLGYRAMSIRLIDLSGRPPAWWTLSKRLFVLGAMSMVCLMPAMLFVTAGQMNNPTLKSLVFLAAVSGIIFLAYWPCITHIRRQAIHDRWGGTWVIRKNAVPIGPAVAVHKTVLLGTFPVRYLDVEPSPPPASSASAPARILPGSHYPISTDAL